MNPLAVFGLRRVDHCPPHFIQFTFDLQISDKTVTDWIYENLTGRFWYGDSYSLNSDRKDARVVMHKCAAFENPGEASYFALQLDTINKHTSW